MCYISSRSDPFGGVLTLGIRAIRLGLILIMGLVAATTATAQMNGEDRKIALALEFQKLRSAQNPAAASVAEQEIWRLWFIGPSGQITDQLSDASDALRKSG